jgi:hypothetical protein
MNPLVAPTVPIEISDSGPVHPATGAAGAAGSVDAFTDPPFTPEGFTEPPAAPEARPGASIAVAAV